MRDVRALDNVSFTDWFKSHGGSEGSIRRMWDPIAYALGFLNCDQVPTNHQFHFKGYWVNHDHVTVRLK